MIKTDGLLRSHPLRTNVAKLTIKGQHKYKKNQTNNEMTTTQQRTKRRATRPNIADVETF